MIVDVIRSCYKTKIRPFTDSDKEYTLTWYPAPEGALLMPDHHIYASSNWMRDKSLAWNGPGEVEGAKKTFLSGRNPPFYLGQCRIGSDDAWRNGLSVEVLNDPPPPVPECCRGQRVFAGLAPFGMSLVMLTTPPPPRGRPNYTFAFTTFTNDLCADCANLNQTFTLNPNPSDPNGWVGSAPFVVCGDTCTWALTYTPTTGIFELKSGPNIFRYKTQTSYFDLWAPFTMQIQSVPRTCRGLPNSLTCTPH